MMLPWRALGGTPGLHMHGATCFSGASVDKVSFNSPRSVDVSPARPPKNWLTGSWSSFKSALTLVSLCQVRPHF